MKYEVAISVFLTNISSTNMVTWPNTLFFNHKENISLNWRMNKSKKIAGIYERMFEEFASDYIHKYDVLRNLVFELSHFAM